jgi:hypothetical protein
MMSNS